MEKARACGGGIMPGLVLCGDFNSTPDSAVYQLMITGKCDSRHEELQSSDVYRWLYDIPLGHGLNLKSSYGFVSIYKCVHSYTDVCVCPHETM